jgi:uncharacterized repeat protein (TIGR03803 family)
MESQMDQGGVSRSPERKRFKSFIATLKRNWRAKNHAYPHPRFFFDPLEKRVLLTSLQTIANFIPAPAGGGPESQLVMDGSGNLYGTTSTGGTENLGTVFEVVKNSNSITTLASFNNVNGADPLAGVVLDSNGDIFGTTTLGGDLNVNGLQGDGTIFEIKQGSGSITTLAQFNDINGQEAPYGVVIDSNGNLYGTTTPNGNESTSLCTVFEWVKSTNTITTLYTFPNPSTSALLSGVVRDADGNLYGTMASSGGAAIYEITNGSNSATTLASLPTGYTQGNLILDGNNDLFGTTILGGANSDGSLFELVKNSNSAITLASFNANGVVNPFGTLALDGSGNLYGMAYLNGTYEIFEWTAASNAIATLAPLSSAYNAQTENGLIIDGNGNLYGTAPLGGTNDNGFVFELPQNSSTITSIASFPAYQSSSPIGILAEDSHGNLFGTSLEGTIFEAPKGENTVITLAYFSGDVSYGSGYPLGVTVDEADNLYGVDPEGAQGLGGIYELVNGSNSPVTIASFNGADGSSPDYTPVFDSHGNLFGTAQTGGDNSLGTVWELLSGSNSITTLASFNGGNGASPRCGLVMDSFGNLFGTTLSGGANSDGTIFEVTPASDSITVLASFNRADGALPEGTVSLDNQGNLFVRATSGGASNHGAVVELAKGSNSITLLASFNQSDGVSYDSGVIADAYGNVYGTTTYQDQGRFGSIYEVVAGSGSITTLFSFNITASGPHGDLLIDPMGNIYGTTESGGIANAGTIFALSPSVVTARYFFYNDSAFNDDSAGGTSADLNAIAPDKTALLPGQTAAYSNLTDYSKGINGIIIDISNLPSGATLTPSDFQFATGDVNDTTTWTPLTTSPTVTLLPATGGVTPVDLTWPNGTITNTWLQVTVLADANTGLASNDVSYYGNLVGKVSDTGSPEQVTALDLTQIENNIVGVATITDPYDVNKDGSVDAEDLVITQRNSFSALRLITPTGDGPVPTAAAAATIPLAITPTVTTATTTSNAASSSSSITDEILSTNPERLASIKMRYRWFR